jgi:hypothetical protein
MGRIVPGVAAFERIELTCGKADAVARAPRRVRDPEEPHVCTLAHELQAAVPMILVEHLRLGFAGGDGRSSVADRRIGAG